MMLQIIWVLFISSDIHEFGELTNVTQMFGQFYNIFSISLLIRLTFDNFVHAITMY